MRTYGELLQENSELRRQLAEQTRQLAEQACQIEKLGKLVEELQRRGKRQAAPFSKGEPKDNPKRPGRKPGPQYGSRASRPRPARVDETVEVGCPLFCESCNGTVRLTGKESQVQIDLPEIRLRTIEFVLHYGECTTCRRRVVGRDSRQASQAVGAAGVQIGPGIVAMATYLNKVGGLSYGKIATLLEQMTGLRVARSTLCRAVQRVASKTQPIYDECVDILRESPVVYPDESGWRIGGLGAWLWAFTNRRETVYSIQRGRGFAEAASVLGKDYAGTLVADGWAPYRRFTAARHQTCLAHLLRRCGEMQKTAQGAAVRFPRQVQALLGAALAVRDRRETAEISPHGVRVAKGRLAAQMDRLLAGRLTHKGNARLAKHLRRNQSALFTFLDHDEIEATNWPAEHAIRPAVVNRKSCGGNRTVRGATAQAVLMSLLRTCHQRGINSLSALTTILCCTEIPSYKLLSAH
jgi:transposase